SPDFALRCDLYARGHAPTSEGVALGMELAAAPADTGLPATTAVWRLAAPLAGHVRAPIAGAIVRRRRDIVAPHARRVGDARAAISAALVRAIGLWLAVARLSIRPLPVGGLPKLRAVHVAWIHAILPGGEHQWLLVHPPVA